MLARERMFRLLTKQRHIRFSCHFSIVGCPPPLHHIRYRA